MTQTKATTGKSIYLDGMIYEGVDADFRSDIFGWAVYLKDNPHINKALCPDPHPFTNFQEVREGVDYVKQWQVTDGIGWISVDEWIFNKESEDYRRIIALPIQAEKREDEMEFLLPPDEGEGWNIGSETFTRREVFNLLHTQRAMISNDIKRECNLDSQDILLSILNNPRIPKF